MGISATTTRARAIAATEREVEQLLRQDQFATNAAVARAAGAGHALVRRVRASLPVDDRGLLVVPARTRALPRTRAEVEAMKGRDLDDMVHEVARLMDEIDALRLENAALRAAA
jgi:hypothetical protein